MSILDNLDPESSRNILKNAVIEEGCVLLKEFAGVDHKKFFIITGLSNNKVYICSVFINSKIHPLRNKKRLLKLQIPLLKKRNSFLSYDSYANCGNPMELETEKIMGNIVNNSCKVIGRIHDEDLEFIRNAIIDSGLLSEEKIELYFNRNDTK